MALLYNFIRYQSLKYSVKSINQIMILNMYGVVWEFFTMVLFSEQNCITYNELFLM